MCGGSRESCRLMSSEVAHWVASFSPSASSLSRLPLSAGAAQVPRAMAGLQIDASFMPSSASARTCGKRNFEDLSDGGSDTTWMDMKESDVEIVKRIRILREGYMQHGGAWADHQLASGLLDARHLSCLRSHVLVLDEAPCGMELDSMEKERKWINWCQDKWEMPPRGC
ncbi:hypothetical protein GUITHDRAFT_154288 [Guillardia theta CCMP2712]|uniref:Uncharacterized protein n=2 Tax=Guillardia theta TaxID=55529 RepID=L1IU91_GUITC|nr:hypothetical protein GUITHDRAFT_154288 [Guillardia theta CCMP2712]EKX39778.1 hypothetical protein GUITHDRAFT_154288 [Guillardia theta CCMP2712]|mmetsp:Transcript_1400/g.4280  ORF Transcript_1400/g.4280 Transcript_1400/m.4280 type:complete len:169 (+) Transcript_1400:432-938(+)|eukprot:XP_005826758.1 hypothetical protein GUITHDRAFT_154288 [Guillardia theta CCMP2712]